MTITAPTVALNLHGVILPAQVVGTTPFKPKIPIVITNETSKLTGTFTVVLYINSSPLFNGSQSFLAMKTERFSLSPHRNKVVPFTFKALSLPEAPGVYYVLAQVTDPTETVDFGASTSTIQIVAANPALHVAPVSVKPLSINLNKSGIATVTVANSGNELLTGMLSISLGVSTDGSTALSGITLARLAQAHHPESRQGNHSLSCISR